MAGGSLSGEAADMQNLDKALIQTIGGWQLTIVIILAQTRRAMSNIELASWTGLTDKTLARHLDRLDASGRIIRTTIGWMLSQAFQLELFSTLRVLAETAPNPTSVVDSEKFRLESENLRLGEPLAVVVESKKNVSTITTTTTTTESEKFRLENIVAFRELGIVGSRPNKVSGLEWVTPDYIRAIVADARKTPGIDNPEGFALTRMEAQAPDPNCQKKSEGVSKTKINSYEAKFLALRERSMSEDE